MAAALFEKDEVIYHKSLPSTSVTIAATPNLLAMASLTLGNLPTGT